MKHKILNSQGKEVLLNAEEKRIAKLNQRHVNALGAKIDITTLTTIIKSVTEQKFFEIAPADYIPVQVGEGAWGVELTTFRSFDLGGDFETGIINTGASNARLAQADAGVDSVSIAIQNWAKGVNWSKPELEFAQRAVNFDLITAKEKSRKRNWDLGIQKTAFLGLDIAGISGLFTQAGTTINLTTITKAISTMTGAELKAFCAVVLGDYRTNCVNTAWPTHFVIPESDYLGLAAPSSADFPLKSVLEVLQDTFKIMTKNPNFQIMPCAYADAANNSLGAQRYALYNADPESIRMDIPVDYTSTLAATMNNFQFESVAYGQFTGVKAYRPTELLYFEF